MSYTKPATVAESIGKQLGGGAMGALTGAVTGNAIPITRKSANPYAPATAVQIGSAMSAALVGGSGLSGTVAAGVGVVTTKVAVVTAAAVACAPAVIIGGAACGIGYALRKLLK